MNRLSSPFTEPKNLALDLTRSTLNYRPSTTNPRESQSRAGQRSSQKPITIESLLNSNVFSEIPVQLDRKTSLFNASLIRPLAATATATQSFFRKPSVPQKTVAPQTPTVESKKKNIKNLLANLALPKMRKTRASRVHFLSFLGDVQFQSIDYSLEPKDQLLKRLFAEVDFSLVKLIAFLSGSLPKNFYKLREVALILDAAAEALPRAQAETVVTKEMVLHQFMPASKLLRLKLLNKDRLDGTARPEFSLKTRILISEVLKKSFNK